MRSNDGDDEEEDVAHREQEPQILDQLRTAERALYSLEVVERLKALPEAERTEFVTRRLALGRAIRELESQRLKWLLAGLELAAPRLRQGVDELRASLQRLDRVTQVTQAIGRVLGEIQKLFPA